MASRTSLTSSLEDYLEAICHIVNEKGAARAKDIATRMGVHGSSVTGALRTLSARGYINYAPYDVITLTERGVEQAREIVRRHRVLEEFFESILGLDAKTSEASACKVEHAVGPNVIERIVHFTEFVTVCPRTGADWLECFARYTESGTDGHCGDCIDACVTEAKKRAARRDTGDGVVTLAKLEPGTKATVRRVNLRGLARSRLADQGLAPGAIVETRKGRRGSFEVFVRGYSVPCDLAEAEAIQVEPVSAQSAAEAADES